jgi:RNA polymerase sigma factor (sigma-70 family)
VKRKRASHLHLLPTGDRAASRRAGARMVAGVRRSIPRRPGPPGGVLTVGGFLTLWLKDPDLAGRVFLTQAKPMADALFRRWRLAVDEAEDAVQEGLLRAYANDEAALRRADPKVLFAAWLHGLIRNLAREAVRHQISRRGHATVEAASESRRRAGRKTERAARAPALPKYATDALTTKEREAFDLYREGLSTPQIADRLDIGREAARERITRAWVTLAHAVVGIMPVERTTLRELSVAETKTLSPRAQRAHALWGAGSSYAAIARTLQCTEAAARGLLQRLRRTLERGPVRPTT